MPVYLRKFYTQQLIEYKEEEKKQIDKSNKKSKIKRPTFKR
tara:strand:+ start:899 stop:1021 length:123 start_codon:yes stop_codon:yes gene_type:complete